MYTASRVKGAKKRNKQARRRSIEDGIPEIPTLADFQVEFRSNPGRSVEDATEPAEIIDESINESEPHDFEEVVYLEPAETYHDNAIVVSEETACGIGEAVTSTEALTIEGFDTLGIGIETHEVLGHNEECEYVRLADEVKTYAQELSEPSAPLLGEQTSASVDVLYPTLRQISEETVEKIKRPKELDTYIVDQVLDYAMTPLSDSQLSEFYYNHELTQCRDFVDEFVHQEAGDGGKVQNPLYELLVSYFKSRASLKTNESKIKDMDKEMDVMISQMWTICEVQIMETEKCKDGNNVVFTQKYKQAHFNHDIYKKFKSVLSHMKYILYDSQTLDSFLSLVLKVKIDLYLQSLMISCPEFTDLGQNASACLQPLPSNLYFQQCLTDLRNSIGVLFLFQRKQKVETDVVFLEETRHWLSDLISLLIRVGSWKDHLFLLSHILRCPGGVASWAARFVQAPRSSCSPDPFSDSEVNHMMTLMAVILQPIEKRDVFLQDWSSIITNDDNPWVVVDSDGEDDDEQSCPLKENDLVLLLNQIPFAYIFERVLKFGDGRCDVDELSINHMLKLFAFCTDFIKILHCGLQEYSTQRYKQFTKRLGRLIRHVVQYATDMLIIFKSLKNVSESEEQRLQIEYDHFFLKSTKFIYSSQKHGAWQFLAIVPYNMASSGAILKLYAILQLSDNSKKLQINLLDFEERLVLLPESEQFYLLSTFTNMALARDLSEIDFIKMVLRQLFYVGFLGSSTKDHCYKNTKSLLFSICSMHPFLMTDILHIQEEYLASEPTRDQRMCVHLWMELPVDMWLPSDEELKLLSNWLAEHVHSVQNELARVILRSLNYGLKDDELFLPAEVHRKIALMVLKTNVCFASAVEAYGMKNVLARGQNPEQTLQQWSWNVLLRLRLHIFDQSDTAIRNCFNDLGEALRNVADVESVNELSQWVNKKHPIACYVGLMTTTLGHSVPIIYNKGFALVEVLLNSGKHEAAIACIEYMTLMFLECANSLYKCEKFISILSQIVAADYSYLKMAKNLISSNFPGPVLQCFVNMIQNQMSKFGGLSPGRIVEIWLMSLTKIPLWTQEPGIVYILDMLMRNCFYDSKADTISDTVWPSLLEATSSPSETKSSFSSLVGWMNASYTPPSLLPKGYNGDAPWFAYKMIQIEHNEHEIKNSLWPELLKELHSSSDKKTNVDSSLKKTCSALQIPSRPSTVLAIYKWTYQILETSISHPLIILIWQKFFTLFLCRVPGQIDRGSVGEKFFDGIINQALFKRLKVRLRETYDYFTACQRSEEDERRLDFLSRSSQLLQTFMLWLDESRLHEPALSIRMLPAQCSPNLLGMIVYGNSQPWFEYLDHDEVQETSAHCISSWLKTKSRNEKKLPKSSSRSEEKSPMERICERLKSYENPMPPPALYVKKSVLPRISLDIFLQTNTMISYLVPSLKVISEYTTKYCLDMNEHVALSCDMQELIRKLHRTKETQVVLRKKCNGVVKTEDDTKIEHECTGAAVVQLKYQEWEVDRSVKDVFNQCVRDFNRCMNRGMAPVPDNLCMSAVLIDNTIDQLKREYGSALKNSNNQKIIRSLKETGVALFYYFVRSWSEGVSFTPSVAKTYSNCIDELGRSFMSGNPEECNRLLTTIMETPKLSDRLCAYFTPNAAATSEFIDMYSVVIGWSFGSVFAVLSKFDVLQWLTENKPKFAERSRLISLIGRGLKADGFGPSKFPDVRELLNYHLEILMLYDFPEHYGEVLQFLLESSETQSISTSTWFTFLNALVPAGVVFTEGQNDDKGFEPGQSMRKLKLNFSKYATEQKLLAFADIKGTMTLLATSFKSDRLKHGLYGLYPKYRRYTEPILILFGMLSHSCVVKTLEQDLGSLSDRIVEQLWPLVNDLFSPWIAPYSTQTEKAQTAHWIQELTDDRCLLLPWIINDCAHASFACNVFVESIRFILDTIPGVHNVLSYVWCFYVTNYAQPHVKEHVVGVIHKSFLSLPWNTFFPSLQDVELMCKVVDQFLPLSHGFLGSLFVEIKWTELVHHYLNSYDAESNVRLHICLLNLFVKLPSEPSLKQHKTVTALLIEANGYAWHLVDSCSYDSILNWFVMSCDPRIILMDERSEYFQSDSIILRLLQSCAGYVASAKLFHPTTLTKRLMFVRASVKWLVTANSRFKCKQSALFKSALCTIWSDIENIVTATVPGPQRVDEAGVLLSEFLNIFKEPDLVKLAEETLVHWISTRRAGVVVFGLLRSLGINVDNPAVYGNITEACIESYFESAEHSDWSEMAATLVPFSSSNCCLEKSLISNCNFLTLHVLNLKRLHRNVDSFAEKMILGDLLQVLSTVKSSEPLEPKIALLMIQSLKLIDGETKRNVAEGFADLVRLSVILNSLAHDRGGGILSTLGLKKCTSPSNRLKLLCLAVCAGASILLKVHNRESQDKIDEKVLQTLEQIENNKQFQNIMQFAAYVKNIVKNVNAIDQIVNLLSHVSTKLFNKLYLK